MKRSDIIRLARIELGVKEQPANSNDGLRVRQYQSTTGAYRAPWCASFAKWVFKQAGATPHERRHMSADVTTWLAYPHLKASDVQPGDAVIYQWDSGDVDHIGIFEKWVAEPHSFDAIEGNTSASNQSNGGEVMRRLRTTDLVAAFVRVKDPEPKIVTKPKPPAPKPKPKPPKPPVVVTPDGPPAWILALIHLIRDGFRRGRRHQ